LISKKQGFRPNLDTKDGLAAVPAAHNRTNVDARAIHATQLATQRERDAAFERRERALREKRRDQALCRPSQNPSIRPPTLGYCGPWR
jgi:hypothetical protein